MLFHAAGPAPSLGAMKDYIVAPNQLAKERLAAGIAEPSELATRAGIDPALYEHIEAGRFLPTLDQFTRLRAALGDVPAERLYAGDMLQLIGAINYAAAIPTPRDVMEWVGGPMKLFVGRDEVTWMEETRRIPDEPVDAFITLSCGTRATPHLLLDALAAAKALVTSCHACMQTATITANRRLILHGTQHPVREMWMGNFLAERVAELGD